MSFVILAIDHGWQMKGYGPETPQMEAAKQAFMTVLTRVVGNGSIGLICEESNPCYISLAQEFAYNCNPRIPWKNIIMTAQERLEAGIYDKLLRRESHCVEEPPGSGSYRTVDHRIPEDDVREQFFGLECIEAMRESQANAALVLCGDMHVEALKRKLEAEGHQAITNHDLIPQCYWQ
jgi:hypothetical protein